MKKIWLSYFSGPIYMTRPTIECTLITVYKFVTSNAKLKALTVRIRGLPKGSEERRKLKMTLPSITPYGTCSQRREANMTWPSYVVPIDIDDMEMSEGAKLRDRLFADERLKALFVFQTVSGGVKALLPVVFNPYISYREMVDNTLNEAWAYIEETYSKDFSFKLDKCNRDLCRACFLCHDENAKIRA